MIMNIKKKITKVIPEVKITIPNKLWQLHWQFKDDHTEFCAQISSSKVSNPNEVNAFIEKCKIRHPLPLGAVWLMCNEDDPRFIKSPVEKT